MQVTRVLYVTACFAFYTLQHKHVSTPQRRSCSTTLQAYCAEVLQCMFIMQVQEKAVAAQHHTANQARPVRAIIHWRSGHSKQRHMFAKTSDQPCRLRWLAPHITTLTSDFGPYEGRCQRCEGALLMQSATHCTGKRHCMAVTVEDLILTGARRDSDTHTLVWRMKRPHGEPWPEYALLVFVGELGPVLPASGLSRFLRFIPSSHPRCVHRSVARIRCKFVPCSC